MRSECDMAPQSLSLALINLSPGLIRPSEMAGSLTRALTECLKAVVSSGSLLRLNPKLPLILFRVTANSP